MTQRLIPQHAAPRVCAMADPTLPPHRTPVVVVVGTSTECTARFLARLVHGDDGVENFPTPAQYEVVRWRLDTKYYVAEVMCVFHELPGEYLVKDNVTDTSLASEVAQNAEALVLCYDPATDGTFQAISRFAEDVRLASGDISGDTSGDGDTEPLDDLTNGSPEVRLVVGLFQNGDDVTSEGCGFEMCKDVADTWAARRGYESVAAGADKNIDEIVIAKSKQFSDDASGCDDGVVRVRNALEAHIWPCLTMKSTAVNGVKRDETKETEGERVDEKPSSAFGEDGDDTSEESPSEDADDLEVMLKEMARVRAAAGSASDEDRRRAAAEAATRMMKMFNVDGDEDDED